MGALARDSSFTTEEPESVGPAQSGAHGYESGDAQFSLEDSGCITPALVALARISTPPLS